MPSKSSDFVQHMLWTVCRHREAEEAGDRPSAEIGACTLAFKEDPRARSEVGRGDCQKADCPYLGREDVP